MESILTVGPIRLNTQSREVSTLGKTAVLTPVESRILQFLADHANTVCSVNQISSGVYGFDNYDGSTALIKAAIRHIRQKVEPHPESPTYILTVPGEGYTLVIG